MALQTFGFATKTTMMEITRHGVAWRAIITHNGQAVGECHNEGRGGQTFVTINPAHRQAYQQAYEANAECGKYEPASRFAELLADQEG